MTTDREIHDERAGQSCISASEVLLAERAQQMGYHWGQVDAEIHDERTGLSCISTSEVLLAGRAQQMSVQMGYHWGQVDAAEVALAAIAAVENADCRTVAD